MNTENNSLGSSTLITHLLSGGIAVLPTDTLYGISGIAKKSATIEEIYRIKHRSPTKPLILLVSQVDQVRDFGIDLTDQMRAQLMAYWPGPTSILLPSPGEEYSYLHRGTQEIAFRLPNYPELCALIDLTGPLAAPSANPESLPPATTVKEARHYFGDKVLYVDGGIRNAPPSALIRIHPDGSVEKLR